MLCLAKDIWIKEVKSHWLEELGGNKGMGGRGMEERQGSLYCGVNRRKEEEEKEEQGDLTKRNMCSYRSMEVKLFALLGNHDRPRRTVDRLDHREFSVPIRVVIRDKGEL